MVLIPLSASPAPQPKVACAMTQIEIAQAQQFVDRLPHCRELNIKVEATDAAQATAVLCRC